MFQDGFKYDETSSMKIGYEVDLLKTSKNIGTIIEHALIISESKSMILNGSQLLPFLLANMKFLEVFPTPLQDMINESPSFSAIPCVIIFIMYSHDW